MTMACGQQPARLAAYMDGELTAAEALGVEEHVRGCSECALEIAALARLRRGLLAARGRYVPDPALKRRIQQQMAKPTRRTGAWLWLMPATIGLAAVVVLFTMVWTQRSVSSQGFGEVADLHVSDLASANPVDVVSTDRHTVKPWFAGRIPFTFNVPEFGGSEYTLMGGRVAYLEQQPGAQLIVGLRQHRISVLIFRETAEMARVFPAVGTVRQRDSFNVATWQTSELRFVVIGDADAAGIEKLAGMMKQANP
ncbi:MAG TPA: zf-HC2 domain-containing protein [Acidobacteriaceae bacterium]